MMLANLDVAHSMKGVVKELVNIKRLLMGKSKRSNTLVKLGLACLAFPEPLASNIAGGMLVTLGYCMGKVRKGNNLRDMLEAVRELRYLISSFHT